MKGPFILMLALGSAAVVIGLTAIGLGDALVVLGGVWIISISITKLVS